MVYMMVYWFIILYCSQDYAMMIMADQLYKMTKFHLLSADLS